PMGGPPIVPSLLTRTSSPVALVATMENTRDGAPGCDNWLKASDNSMTSEPATPLSAPTAELPAITVSLLNAPPAQRARVTCTTCGVRPPLAVTRRRTSAPLTRPTVQPLPGLASASTYTE